MSRRLAAALGAALVLFHGWLLAGQAWHGALGEPAVVLRWLVAAGLGIALGYARRGRGSMFRGRKAIAIWLLAAALHGPALAGSGAADETQALPEAVVLALQAATASVLTGLGLALMGALFLTRSLGVPKAILVTTVSRLHASGVGKVQPFAPRPPPRFLLSLS